MNFEEAVEYLKNLPNCGFERYGTTGILRLLEVLGNPQDSFKVLHIAGTNGKGSVSTYCASALKEAGFKTGLYTSPYIVNFFERIQINGEFILEEEFLDLFERLSFLVLKINEEGFFLTEFDFITALAIEYFFEKGCEFVVLEVGMGGRLDSTNVVSCPIATVITHIDYDHVKELGGQDGKILNIAKEKAGILKKGSLFIFSRNQFKEVSSFFKKEAKEKDIEFFESFDVSDFFCGQEFSSFKCDGKVFKIALLGFNQIENASLAVTVLLKIGLDIKYIKKGLEKAFIPARFEILKKDDPLTILDGAHNENAIDCLKKNLNIFKNTPKIGVLSIISTKNFSRMMFKIKGVFETVVLTKMSDERAVDPFVLQKEAEKNGIKFFVEQDVVKALQLGKKLALKKGLVVVFGSLYFASQVRSFFK